MVQRCAARWARGAHGIISVTKLLRDLNWLDLADRRRVQRLSLFYKVLHGDLDIPPQSVDLIRTSGSTRTRRSHQWSLQRASGKDKSSPLWKGTVLRTLPDWNGLPSKTVEADSASAFKSQLGRPLRP